MKANLEGCFTNKARCTLTGKTISMVPDDDDFSDWNSRNPSKLLQKRARKALDGLYGQEVEGLPIKQWRICW